MLNNLRHRVTYARIKSSQDNLDQFKTDCENWISPHSHLSSMATQIITPGEKYCIRGSVLLAANTSFSIKPYFAKSNGYTTDFIYEESDEFANPLAVLGSSITRRGESGQQLDYTYPISIIKANQALKLQCVWTTPSVYFSYISDNKTIESGSESIVSTLRKGNIKIGLSIIYSENSRKIKMQSLSLISKKNLTYFYNRDQYFDFAYSYFPLDGHKDRNGTLGPSACAEFRATMSQYEKVKANVSVSGNVTISWQPTASASAATDDDEFLFPEFTASLSTKEGVFTLDNIDQKFPSMLTTKEDNDDNLEKGDADQTDESGLPWWSILLIVIGAIIVITIIFVAIVFIFVFKKARDNNSEKSEENI